MNTTVAKWFFIAGTLLFADWLIMVLFGCIASVLKAEETFYCTTFCSLGILLLVFTGFLIIYFALARAKKSEN